MKTNSYFFHFFILVAIAGSMFLQGCSNKKPKSEATNVLPVTPTVVDEAKPIGDLNVPAKAEELIDVGPLTTSYTVAKGDTLSNIAAQYGLRWQDIAGVNPGLNPKTLRIGQVIQLPGNIDISKKKAVVSPPPKSAKVTPVRAGKTVSYKVQKGDSLSVIAHKFGTKVNTIKEVNNLKSDLIREGQVLHITGATHEPSKTATPAKIQPPKVDKPVSKPAAPAKVEPEVLPEEVIEPVNVEPTTVTPAPTPEPVAVAPVNNASQTYVVKEGEDLYAVAIRWGVNPSELKALNNLSGHELRAGQVLKIPPVSPAP